MKTRAERTIETVYLTEQRNNTYIPLEDEEFDWFWDLADVEEFDQLRKGGMSIWELAEYFGRSEDEVAILIIDRGRKNKL